METHALAHLFPPMADDDYAALRDSVAAVGVRHPIVLTHDGLLVDGVHRLRAAQETGQRIPTVVLEPDADLLDVVLAENMARRHMTESQRAMVAAKLSEQSTVGGDRRSGKNHSANLPNDRLTTSEAADKLNVSERSVRSARSVRRRGAEQLTTAVETGHVAVSDAVKVLAKPDESQARFVDAVARGDAKTLVDAAKEHAKSERQAERERRRQDAMQRHATGRVACCSCADMAANVESASIDAVFTDPPYGTKHARCWDELARFAVHAIKPGGVLLALAPHQHMFDYHRRLEIDGLVYRWCAAYIYDRPSQQVHSAKVTVGWKPVLAFTRTGAQPAKYAQDVFLAEPYKAEYNLLHKWGQNHVGMLAIASEWLEPGWKVCDPFAGGGSLLVAARDVGCAVLGCDIDAGSAALANEALAKAPPRG